jgi:glycosyltransferase involved in cell wall biosynthesis
MTKTVLFDQSNTVFRMGTGVATYARNLAVAARVAGYRADGLLSTEVKVNLNDPVLAEVQLYDVERKPLLPWVRLASIAMQGAVRAPFGYRPGQLKYQGVVQQSSGPAPMFDQTYVTTRLFEAARAQFHAYGRFTRVRLPVAPALFHATHPLPVHVEGCPNIVTIHDLVPLRLPFMTLDNKRYFFRLVRTLLERADHIITVSEFSRQDIIRLFGIPESRITNTYQAVSLPESALARPDDEIADEITNLFDLDPGNYYLFLGAFEPKKNVSRLIDAYAASGSRRPLVLTGGKGWQNETDMERIKDPRFASYRITDNSIFQVKRIRHIPFLPLSQLVTLIRGARAVLFPSLFEGFGLPVLEAMTLGTPVLTSNVTSLPEIAGDAALLVDPTDIGAMAAAIRRLDNEVDLLDELSARGKIRAQEFSMVKYQARVRDVYARLIGPGGNIFSTSAEPAAPPPVPARNLAA